MAGALQGKLLGVKINGNYIRCQTDATLAIAISTSDEEGCKPTETEATNSQSWGTNKVNSKSWTLSVTAKTFADVVSGTVSNSEIANAMITGTPSVEVSFQTIKTSDYSFPNIFIYEGTGTLTSFTVNAPIEGNGTYDLEITGNGALTYTEIPVTPGGNDLFVGGFLSDTGILDDSQTYNLS